MGNIVSVQLRDLYNAFIDEPANHNADVRAFEEHIGKLDELLAAALRRQRQTAQALQGALEAQKHAEEARALAEVTAQEHREMSRCADEAREMARTIAEKRATESADALHDLEEKLRKEHERGEAKEGKADEDAEERWRAQRDLEELKRAQEEAYTSAAGARARQEELERQLSQGLQPIIDPTEAQRSVARAKVARGLGVWHCAIAGVSGSGRSSLVNALRGLRNSDEGAAATGIADKTTTTTVYADNHKIWRKPLVVWYDVPGAGTLTVPEWQYFLTQGLYTFNCIIVLFDNRLTTTDAAILRNCMRLQIPTFIARTKSGQHIRNLAADTGSTRGENSAGAGKGEDRRVARVRQQYIRETRASVARNLELAGLPPQRVYAVDKDVLVQVVKGDEPSECFDEVDLIDDIRSMSTAGRSQFL